MSSSRRKLLFGRPIEEAARAHENDPGAAVESIRRSSDRVFHTWIFAVAALGFLTDSYNLFASNVILPAISFVYWDNASDDFENGFNVATLLATMIGQIGFGWLADKTGRQAVFGYELLIVVVSTLGLVQCSKGYADGDSSTWDFTSWLFFWRITMGVGIGAAYPLSAVLAAEWSATPSRGRVMAAVFLMQPLGQLLACIVGLAAVQTRSSSSRVEIDEMWRIVVGAGAFPTLLTLAARMLLPESWRYTWFVAQEPADALQDLLRKTGEQGKGNDVEMQTLHPPQAAGNSQDLDPNHEKSSSQSEEVHFASPRYDGKYLGITAIDVAASSASSQHRSSLSSAGRDMRRAQPETNTHNRTSSHLAPPTSQGVAAARQQHFPEPEPEEVNVQPLPAGFTHFISFMCKDDYEYLLKLIGVSTSWFLLDYAFYGMGFFSTATLAKLWAPSDLYFRAEAPWWQKTSGVSNTTTPSGAQVINGVYVLNGTIADDTIKEVLTTSVKNIMLTTSCAAIAGGGLFVLAAPYINRRQLLLITYAILAVLLAIIAGILQPLFHQGRDGRPSWLLILFWILAQFTFSFGPNTLTFILPAEVFPTRYRCTCYGIAAAFGKLGAVAVQGAIWGAHMDPNDSMKLRALMASFAAAMVLGALLTFSSKRLIPDTQGPLDGRRAPDLPLESCSDDIRFLPASARTSSD